ncbi:MAG: hypothetical protein ABIR81_07575 [Ginsengibacter sp.]
MLAGIRLTFFCLLLFSLKSLAQEFGGNKPSIKWKQIVTSKARIIFPSAMDSQAIHIANTIQQIDAVSAQSIGVRSKPVSLVLQNQTTISNGYVSLGPFRSEFYLTPLQNSFELGSLPWSDQLAIHEYRHVQQYNNFNIGLSKIFSTIFGQQGQAFANNVAIPNWFFEGDAVYNETYFSNQGRGRLPNFFNPYRSLWQQQKKYNWQTLRNGSYNKFIPDHYALGYLLAAYGRKTYGDDFWKDVTHDAAAFKGLFYPLQKAVKKYSGVSYKTFRNKALDFFKDQFVTEDSLINVSPQAYKDEEYPVLIGGDSIIFVKTSYDKPHQFVLIDRGHEKTLNLKAVSLDNHFSYANNTIAYSTYRPDLRWGYRDFNEIELFNIVTKKHKRLTTSSKYFSPSLSPKADSVVAVNINTSGKANLDILSMKDGSKLSALVNNENLFYTYPIFARQQIISAVRNTAGQMSIQAIDVKTLQSRFIIPFSYNVIAFPFYKNDTLFFSASSGKQDKVFAYVFNNGKLFFVDPKLKTGIGKYQFNVSDNSIVFSTFTANGFRIETLLKSAIEFVPVSAGDMQLPLPDFGVSTLGTNPKPDTANQFKYTVTPYAKSKGLIAFHSIQPYISDPEYAITLVSDNILNTMGAQLAYTYNRSERFSKVSASAVYAGLFPLLYASVDYSINRRGFYNGKLLSWNEFEPGVGISVPLNFSRLNHLTFLNVGSRYTLNNSQYKGIFKDSISVNTFSYLNHSFRVTNQSQSARKNIFPKWAQTLAVNYKHAVTGYAATQLSTNGNIYLPGLIKNHSLVLNGAFLSQSASNEINFSSGFPFSKGYIGQNLQHMYKFGVNYNLPLAYPDAGIANVVYLLRLRTNLFYDHTYAKETFDSGFPYQAYFRSAGTELFFDTKWWNVMPVSFGFRYSYLFDEDAFGGSGHNRFEVILPANLFQ